MNLARPPPTRLSSLLFLSESDVRRCLPISTAIEANRKALGSLRLDGEGGAVVPTRIGLPYHRKDSGAARDTEDGIEPPDDWTLFKPAAYYPPDGASGGGDEDGALMGMKLVSVRAGNPSLGKPSVPATVTLVDARTGEVRSVLGGTYLTAARTAAGSAIATEVALRDRAGGGPIHLVVFGAGLQAELHVGAVRRVRSVGRVTIVNRTAGRAEGLREIIRGGGAWEAGGEGEGEGGGRPSEVGDVDVVLLSDDDGVRRALGEADVICTTTNTATPLFPGEWVKSGCHINGIGSYTARMEEVDSGFASTRCQVIVDTKEALDVGDLKGVSLSSGNFIGLLGDVIAGNASLKPSGSSGQDCTFFKSVGTAIQDVITAHAAVEAARSKGIGTNVNM